MAETVLVTGGAGYVAGWCIVALLKQGYDVRATLRNLSQAETLRSAIATGVDGGDRLRFFAADLTSDAGWDAAMAGCDYVLHVASPMGLDNPKDPEALSVPAREGTLRVLRAASRAGVRRVVMTSACAAASPALYSDDGVTDETLWTDPDAPRLTSYRRSKTQAELAAWQFMKDHDGPMTLATVLPGAVFGPVLSADKPGSVQVIGRMLQGRVLGSPRLGFEIVDVRDLADIHLRAMTSPQAAGQRFIAVGGFMWMAEMAQALRGALGTAAAKVPKRSLPDFVFRAFALIDPSLRAVAPGLGRRHRHTAAKAETLLGWRPRPTAETVVACAESLIARGMV